MKRVAIVVILVLAAAVLGFWRSSGGVRQGLSRVVGAAGETQQGDAREEIRKSFQLQPGARIEIAGINGKVEVETSDTKTAEVYVLRIAGNRDSLNRREVTVEQTSTGGLVVKARQVSHGFWEHLFGTKSNENVTIKAPRAIVLAIRGVNGSVISGDVDGANRSEGNQRQSRVRRCERFSRNHRHQWQRFSWTQQAWKHWRAVEWRQWQHRIASWNRPER
jgi:hypothetical protein